MARDSKKNRPNIWADGSQNPPFELRSFALASVRLARDSLSGLLTRCSDSARDFGTVVDDGPLPVERCGDARTGEHLGGPVPRCTTLHGGGVALGDLCELDRQVGVDLVGDERVAQSLHCGRERCAGGELCWWFVEVHADAVSVG